MEGKSRTRAVGSRFVQNGKTYEVVECEKDSCLVCDMYDGAPDIACGAEFDVTGMCWKGWRSDDKNVCFKEVRE